MSVDVAYALELLDLAESAASAGTWDLAARLVDMAAEHCRESVERDELRLIAKRLRDPELPALRVVDVFSRELRATGHKLRRAGAPPRVVETEDGDADLVVEMLVTQAGAAEDRLAFSEAVGHWLAAADKAERATDAEAYRVNADRVLAEWRAFAAVSAIAKRRLGVPVLVERNADRLDFHDVGVGSLRDALLDAYRAGRDASRRG